MVMSAKSKIIKTLLVATLALSLGGCGIFSSDKEEDFEELGSRTTAIGVNGYLWQATLDTLSFMPMASLDPASAAILTEWYADPSAPGERFKIIVKFYGETLRADGIQLTVNRQMLSDGNWVDAAVKASTSLELEEAILTRARELRIGTAQ